MNRGKRFSKVITVKNQLKENNPRNNKHWTPDLNIIYSLGWKDKDHAYVSEYLEGNWNSYEEYEQYKRSQK